MGLFGNMELAKFKTPRESPAYLHLQTADQALKRATSLTRQLLTFAKGGDPVLEEVNPRSVIQDTVAFNLSGSNVYYRFNAPHNLWHMKADKGQISQVIANLTINAKESMPEGGVLYINAENISDVDPDLQGDFVKLTIRDEGVGIQPKYLDKIFDPYFSTKQTGSGLGLATAHSIITRHNGRISVESNLKHGTIFTIYLPAQRSSAEPDSASGQKAPEKADSVSGHVLVMDDEEMLRDLYADMLQLSGYTVDCAADGREAIRKFSAAAQEGNPFDIVIMDLTIPGGMGGKETVKEILAIDPEAKVIVASGYSDDPVVADYRDYGFHGTLIKPFQIEDLKKELRRVMSQIYV
jgi:CheY-like chemotaxis protein